MIVFESVTKQFEKKIAVNNVSFMIQPCRLTALVGENGSGKTTIMRMIATLLKPTIGAITINGQIASHNTDLIRKQIGLMLGGDAMLIKRLSARENIEYYALLQGLSKKDAKVRTETLAKILNMQSYIDKRVETFSRGMRQKVLFAQTIVHNPQILLLDEPTTGLDIFAALELQKVIKDFCNEERTVLISSHNMNEIENLCSDIIMIHKGNLLYNGSIDKLKEQYQTKKIEDAFAILTNHNFSR